MWSLGTGYQEEVRRIRKEPTIVENSGVRDSRPNGAAERGVQAIGEQVRVTRYGLESRLGIKPEGSHGVTRWLVEHCADVLNKHSVGEDGRTLCERWKGKAGKLPAAEFGEKVHYRFNVKRKPRDEKLEAHWGEGYFLWKV